MALFLSWLFGFLALGLAFVSGNMSGEGDAPQLATLIMIFAVLSFAFSITFGVVVDGGIAVTDTYFNKLKKGVVYEAKNTGVQCSKKFFVLIKEKGMGSWRWKTHLLDQVPPNTFIVGIEDEKRTFSSYQPNEDCSLESDAEVTRT